MLANHSRFLTGFEFFTKAMVKFVLAEGASFWQCYGFHHYFYFCCVLLLIILFIFGFSADLFYKSDTSCGLLKGKIGFKFLIKHSLMF